MIWSLRLFYPVSDLPLPPKQSGCWVTMWRGLLRLDEGNPYTLCRKSRQVVAYGVGHRSKKTCQRLWEAIPQEYRQGHCFTDFLKVYASVIPEEQHTAVSKETGETAHVERWNNTLRQRLARFVRMTVSFSKSEIMLRPPVSCSSFTAIISSGLSFSSEPLPKTR